MIVQWCIKGLSLSGDDEAKEILGRRSGLCCSWWRAVHTISATECRQKLTVAALDHHVNHFKTIDPDTGLPYGDRSPFISLTAGVVERDAAKQTNHVRGARQTALWFGTNFGRAQTAYLFLCWVIVGPRQAVEVEGVAEEVRDLNAYRRYSAYQPEGEITAKVSVPDNQILGWERWDKTTGRYTLVSSSLNPNFTAPEMLSNIRDEL